MIIEQLGFVLICPADAAGIVRLGEQRLVYDIDGQRLHIADALVGVMGIAHADHDPVMADNAEVSNQRPVGLAVYHRSHDHQRGRVQRQFRTDIFLHCLILLISANQVRSAMRSHHSVRRPHGSR